ncbi:MAG: N,N-dimethylformamidase beta subunit family domain-containing protein [Polyangiales bacterium]
MRRSHIAAVVAFFAASSSPLSAWAKNAIEIENEKPVDPVKDSWLPPLDPSTYEAKSIGINGVVDVYPSAWSVKNGDNLGIRVSTVAGKFRTRIYRIGWYGNSPAGPVGSRLVQDIPETAGEKQPFPAENDQTGLAEARWHDSVTVNIGGDWTPGHYAIRVTTDSGMDAFSHFIVRDDTSPNKAVILYVDTQFTEQAYNPWPKIMDASGKQLSGKSTYSYNSMGVDVKASGAKQAVEVSLDRPGGENWGLGIWRDWTVPTVQFLEKHGYDVAYANSVDLDAGYVLGSRKMWMDAGHDEYWTRAMWDNVAAGRDSGLNLAWFSGNDLSWQVRLEPGSSGNRDKMVAYKIAAYPDEGRCGSCWDWGGDPEFVLALKAKAAGDATSQVTHLKNVSYAWAGLKDWDPNAPSTVFPGQRGAPVDSPVQLTRLAISFEGLMNGPKLPACPASAPVDSACRGVPWVVENAEHWVYTGAGVNGGVPSGLANGDRIPLIVGYEMDNARLDRTYSSRPTTQVILAHTDAVFTPDKGSATDFSGQFNAQYYQHKNGAHVFAAGTINWFWGVEREGAGNWGGINLKTPVKPGVTVDQVVTAITVNVLQKLQEGPGLPPAQPGPDGGVSFGDGGVAGGAPGAGDGSTSTSGGCAVSPVGSARDGLLVLLALGASGLILSRRKKSVR